MSLSLRERAQRKGLVPSDSVKPRKKRPEMFRFVSMRSEWDVKVPSTAVAVLSKGGVFSTNKSNMYYLEIEDTHKVASMYADRIAEERLRGKVFLEGTRGTYIEL